MPGGQGSEVRGPRNLPGGCGGGGGGGTIIKMQETGLVVASRDLKIYHVGGGGYLLNDCIMMQEAGQVVMCGDLEVYRVGTGPKCVLWCHDFSGFAGMHSAKVY
jgi:hypothetical protein